MSEEQFDFKSLKNYKSSFDLVKWMMLLLALAFCSALIMMFVISNNKIKEANEKIWIMDAKGFVYPASMTDYNLNDKLIEYHNHTTMLVKLWYEFDEGSYDKNIEQGLYLLGDCGKDMKDVYNQYNIKNQLYQKNLRYTVEILEIVFNTDSNPHQGYVVVEQTVTRGLNEKKRIFEAYFIILDEGISRSYENPHGLKIENFKVNENPENNTNK